VCGRTVFSECAEVSAFDAEKKGGANLFSEITPQKNYLRNMRAV
jgi:hypothetical protein